MTKYERFEANGKRYMAWVKDGKVYTQAMSGETATLKVRTGAWDDIMNSCYYKELLYIDRYIICIDAYGEIFARNNYNA